MAMIPSLKEVREALEPFAREAAAYESDVPDALHLYARNEDGDIEDCPLTVGDLRRAAALYESLLSAEAEANVSAVRSWDAPGFGACVKAEREKLASPSPSALTDAKVRKFADELRKWWSFDNGQMHTHSWHSREDFIEQRLPALLASALTEEGVTEEIRQIAAKWTKQSHILLCAGEMGAAELRAIKAVTNAIAREIASALSHKGENP